MDSQENNISINGYTNGDVDEDNRYEVTDGHHNLSEIQLDIMFQDFESYLRPVSKLSEPDYEKLKIERKMRNEQVIATTFVPAAKRKQDTDLNNKEVSAAVCIQKYIRGFQARKLFVKLLQIQFEKEEAQRQLKRMEQVEEGELLVENYHLETEIRDEIVALRNLGCRLHYYATVIQRAWRKRRQSRTLMKDLGFNGVNMGGKEYLI